MRHFDEFKGDPKTPKEINDLLLLVDERIQLSEDKKELEHIKNAIISRFIDLGIKRNENKGIKIKDWDSATYKLFRDSHAVTLDHHYMLEIPLDKKEGSGSDEIEYKRVYVTEPYNFEDADAKKLNDFCKKHGYKWKIWDPLYYPTWTKAVWIEKEEGIEE